MDSKVIVKSIKLLNYHVAINSIVITVKYRHLIPTRSCDPLQGRLVMYGWSYRDHNILL